MLPRLAGACLLLALGLGSLMLWVVVPVASFRAAWALAESRGGQLALALPLTLLAMVLWALALAGLNGVYLRLTGAELDDDGADGNPWRQGGPLEPLLVWSLFLALAAFLVWFFAFAENPPPGIGM